MEAIAERITRYIFTYGEIKKEDYDIYKHGIQTGMEMLSCLLISTIIAIYIKSFLKFVIFVAVFFPLRSYVGGFHLKHFVSCCFCSCCVVAAVLIGSRYLIPSQYVSAAISSGALCMIYRLAQKTTKKQIADEAEAAFFSHQRKRMILCIMVLNMVFLVFNLREYLALIMYIMLVVLSSMVLERR